MPLKFYSLWVVFAFFGISNAYPADFPFLGQVNSDAINLRAEPNVRSESVTKLKKDAKLKVMSEKFGWYKVAIPENIPCYISRKYINFSGENEATVNADRVNLRLSPSEKAYILGQTNKGQKVKLLKAQPEWCNIIIPQDLAFGWVHKKFIDYYSAEINPVIILSAPVPSATPLATGVIRPMGIFFRRKGTHKLVSNGKTAYYLKSEDKDLLNSCSGYPVNIFGKIIENDNQKIPLVIVETIEIVSPVTNKPPLAAAYK